ncbi:hypothetical protein Pmani_036950 [Petrolisthes manimaculis]|uniref:Uncharacterized protein n=1 Tax=Petrolisthes manimaculis TaxID=1843537 RepID=A0AAE1NJ76_9EUCA|nr:hypothetical protein Pmani_036950 [Petrolisthes manimaculis]
MIRLEPGICQNILSRLVSAQELLKMHHMTFGPGYGLSTDDLYRTGVGQMRSELKAGKVRQMRSELKAGNVRQMKSELKAGNVRADEDM